MRRAGSYDSLYFNGIDIANLVLDYKMGRAVMAPREVTYREVPGMHGAHHGKARLRPYTLPVQVWLDVDDKYAVADARSKLAAALWTEGPAQLVLPDDPSRYLLATVDGVTDIEDILQPMPEATISFLVLDPIAYGDLRSASANSSGSMSVHVGGTWEARPTIESVAAGGTWRATNTVTSEFVEVNADSFGAAIQQGAAIVCDMADERLTINGSDAGVAVSSDFWAMSGDATVTISGASSATMTWRERWL